MASKSYGCDVRNISKSSPKMTKKQSIFTFYSIFSKTLYDSNEIFYSQSTPHYGPFCAVSLDSYGWDVKKIAKFNAKLVKKQSFFDFRDFRKNCSYDLNEIFYSHSTP